jgi:hypothetical protein
MLPDARRGETARSTLTAMNCAERMAEHVNGQTVVAAGLFQRRGTAAAVGDEGGLPSGADPESDAPEFPSNTILAGTDAHTLYAFHRDPRDGLIGRWPLGEVGAKVDARESNLNYLEIVGRWELLLISRTVARRRSNARSETMTAWQRAMRSQRAPPN